MQLFGILLVLNRKSRLGRQQSRTSGASRVRRANGHWKNATVWCVQCPTIDGGEEAATIDEYARRGKVSYFFSIYQAFFHKSPTTNSSKSFYLPPCLHGPHARTTCDKNHCGVYCEMHLITNWQTNPVRHPCSVHCTYKVLHRTTLCSAGLLKFRGIFWLVDLGVEDTMKIMFRNS